MNSKIPVWLLGLTQALIVISVSIVLYTFFQQVMPINSRLFYVAPNPVSLALSSTLWAVSAITGLLVYFLCICFIPLYFFITNRGLVGLKALAYTAGFLVFFVGVTELVVYIVYKNTPNPQGKQINQNYPTLYQSECYIPPDELIKKSELTKQRAEQARLDYERLIEQRQEEGQTKPIKEINLENQYKLAPYTIDITTGERTPINP